jgi:hypothetical protein
VAWPADAEMLIGLTERHELARFQRLDSSRWRSRQDVPEQTHQTSNPRSFRGFFECYRSRQRSIDHRIGGTLCGSHAARAQPRDAAR